MFTLDRVVPWGRSFDEYRHMFALSEIDLRSRILGCADGPAGFNAEASRRGVAVVSCDPLYGADASQIRQRIEATFDEVLEQTRRNADEFVWDTITSIDELASLRRAAMDTFLADYEGGKAEGRYVEAELPVLPFSDHSFDLAVCSHFLFLYSDQLETRSIGNRCMICVEWPGRFESFRCSRWAADRHRMSRPLRQPRRRTAATCQSRSFRTNSSAAASR